MHGQVFCWLNVSYDINRAPAEIGVLVTKTEPDYKHLFGTSHLVSGASVSDDSPLAEFLRMDVGLGKKVIVEDLSEMLKKFPDRIWAGCDVDSHLHVLTAHEYVFDVLSERRLDIESIRMLVQSSNIADDLKPKGFGYTGRAFHDAQKCWEEYIYYAKLLERVPEWSDED